MGKGRFRWAGHKMVGGMVDEMIWLNCKLYRDCVDEERRVKVNTQRCVVSNVSFSSLGETSGWIHCHRILAVSHGRGVHVRSLLLVSVEKSVALLFESVQTKGYLALAANPFLVVTITNLSIL